MGAGGWLSLNQVGVEIYKGRRVGKGPVRRRVVCWKSHSTCWEVTFGAMFKQTIWNQATPRSGARRRCCVLRTTV